MTATSTPNLLDTAASTTTAGAPNATPVTDSSSAGIPAGAPPAGEQTPPSTPPQTPPAAEPKFDLKLGESAFANDDYVKLAKDLKLAPDAAQKVLDTLAPALQAQGESRLQTLRDQAVTQWAEETRANPMFGGDKLTANMAFVHKALELPGGDKLQSLLKTTGFGNKLEVLSYLAEIGRRVSPDAKIVTGSEGHVDLPSDPIAQLAARYETKSR